MGLPVFDIAKVICLTFVFQTITFCLLGVIVNYNWSTIETIFFWSSLAANVLDDPLYKQKTSFATESQRRYGKWDVHNGTILVIYLVRLRRSITYLSTILH